MRVPLLLLVHVGSVLSTLVCPPKYFSIEGRCIRPYTLNANDYLDIIMDYAQAACALDGATLPIIRSDEDNDMFTRIAQTFLQPSGTRIYLVLGVVCDEETDMTRWPENQWKRLLLGDAHLFTSLCVLEEQIATTDEVTEKPDNKCGDYERMEEGMDDETPCFKVFTEPQSWENAQKKCEADFGSLIAISSAEENSFFWNVATTHKFTGGMHIGAHQCPDDSTTWTWIDGEIPITSNTYNNFIRSFPIAGSGKCASMVTESVAAAWVNVDCYEDELPFICQRGDFSLIPSSCPNAAPKAGEEIFSPSYPKSDISCEYFLTVSEDKLVEVEIISLISEKNIDYLEIREGTSGMKLLANLTGTLEKPTKFTTSKSNVLRVNWKPVGTADGRGFKIRYTEVDKVDVGQPATVPVQDEVTTTKSATPQGIFAVIATLLFLHFVSTTAVTQLSCPPNYFFFEDKCIRPFAVMADDTLLNLLPLARESCAQDGAHLPMIRSHEENESYARLVNLLTAPPKGRMIRTNLMDLPNEVLVNIFDFCRHPQSIQIEIKHATRSGSTLRFSGNMYSNGADLPHNPPDMNAFVQDYTYFNRLRFGLQRLAQNTRVQDLRIQMQPMMTDAVNYIIRVLLSFEITNTILWCPESTWNQEIPTITKGPAHGTTMWGGHIQKAVQLWSADSQAHSCPKAAYSLTGQRGERVCEMKRRRPVFRTLHCTDDSIEDVAESCTLDLEISSDCDRGLRFHYCTMTLHKPSGELDWTRTGKWRFLLSSSPIFTLPCLARNGTSVTVVCQERHCNDMNLDANIELCTKELLRRNEAGNQHSSTCDANSASDNQTLSCLCVEGLLIVFLLQLLQYVHAKRNAAKLEKMRHKLNVSSRANGNSENYEEYDSASELHCNKEIVCGDQKYVLSEEDCNRGLVNQYCTKTLIRSSNDNQTNNVDLKFTTKELLPDYSYVWQTEKGTLYYAKFVVNWVLYVMFEGKKVTTKLPAEFGMESVSSLGVRKIIYIGQIDQEVAVEQFNADILIIKIPMTPKYKWSFGHDSSPYFYITNGESLFTINTDTRKILTTLKFRGVNSLVYIAGVFGSEISLMVNQDGWKLISAQLPDGYFVDVSIAGDNNGAIAYTEDRCASTGWKRTNGWELLLSSEPIANVPCLVMNETTMIIFCDSKQCKASHYYFFTRTFNVFKDSRLDMDIKNCADKCKERMTKMGNDEAIRAGRSIQHEDNIDVVCPLNSLHSSTHLLNAHRDAARVEKMQKEIFLNTALPEIPRSSSRQFIDNDDPNSEMVDY
ncbi:hypothetical protein PRIPAC_86576 [Pristionchus pacificus]|uniref:CUB domain-containing protein n=1 Tax=Pristionchus pacificus TaxID=54126 RepID=A0A2A6BSR1_PRIPA|nr:hypothetical protein PRIPAC_86576 [Pristionchus pacificus]|eukprot:PDM68856.1 CUB domain-containing protein [Pristionchus pacificus]